MVTRLVSALDMVGGCVSKRAVRLYHGCTELCCGRRREVVRQGDCLEKEQAPNVQQVKADTPSVFTRISRTAGRPQITNCVRAVKRRGCLRHGIEPQRESPCEAMLPLRLEGMKLSGVTIAQQPLEPHAPEQPSAAHSLERLFDAQP